MGRSWQARPGYSPTSTGLRGSQLMRGRMKSASIRRHARQNTSMNILQQSHSMAYVRALPVNLQSPAAIVLGTNTREPIPNFSGAPTRNALWLKLHTCVFLGGP